METEGSKNVHEYLMVEKVQDNIFQYQELGVVAPLPPVLTLNIRLGGKLHKSERQKYALFAFIGDLGGL